MNLRTTLVLFALALGGAVVWKLGPQLPARLDPRPSPPPAADAGTLTVFEEQFTPDKISRVEVSASGKPAVVFVREGKSWTMPGGWPTRAGEVQELIDRLASLRSRFQPLPLTGEEGELKPYGLSSPACTVRIETNERKHQLAFGEGSVEENTFYRPTYVRLDQKPEVIRLGPGLLSVLARPAEYYRKRRLFPVVREFRSPDSSDKVERLDAERVTIESRPPEGSASS